MIAGRHLFIEKQEKNHSMFDSNFCVPFHPLFCLFKVTRKGTTSTEGASLLSFPSDGPSQFCLIANTRDASFLLRQHFISLFISRALSLIDSWVIITSFYALFVWLINCVFRTPEDIAPSVLSITVRSKVPSSCAPNRVFPSFLSDSCFIRRIGMRAVDHRSLSIPFVAHNDRFQFASFNWPICPLLHKCHPVPWEMCAAAGPERPIIPAFFRVYWIDSTCWGIGAGRPLRSQYSLVLSSSVWSTRESRAKRERQLAVAAHFYDDLLCPPGRIPAKSLHCGMCRKSRSGLMQESGLLLNLYTEMIRQTRNRLKFSGSSNIQWKSNWSDEASTPVLDLALLEMGIIPGKIRDFWSDWRYIAPSLAIWKQVTEWFRERIELRVDNQ